FFSHTPTTQTSTLSLHDALPISQRLSDMLRVEDSVARLGGDEFVLLLMLNNRDSDAVFHRIIDSIRRPINLGDVEVTVSASLGRSEEHTSELQSRENLVCRLLLE